MENHCENLGIQESLLDELESLFQGLQLACSLESTFDIWSHPDPPLRNFGSSVLSLNSLHLLADIFLRNTSPINFQASRSMFVDNDESGKGSPLAISSGNDSNDDGDSGGFPRTVPDSCSLSASPEQRYLR